jgi:hypothetical protein
MRRTRVTSEESLEIREDEVRQEHRRSPPRSLTDEMWQFKEEQHGTRYPDRLRVMLERRIRADDQQLDWDEYDDLKALIDYYEESGEHGHLNELLVSEIERRGRKKSDASPEDRTGHKLTYAKPRRRRLRILTFVADRYFTAQNVIDGHLWFDRRIQWARVCDEWNAQYPSDLFTARTLQARYYEARREQDMVERYFERLYQEMAEPILTPLAAGVAALAQELRDVNPENRQLMRRMAEEHPQVWADLLDQLIIRHNDHVGARLQEAGIVSMWPIVDRRASKVPGSVWRRALRQPLGEKLKFRTLRKDIAEVKRFAGRLGWQAVSLPANPYWVRDDPERRNARKHRR